MEPPRRREDNQILDVNANPNHENKIILPSVASMSMSDIDIENGNENNHNQRNNNNEQDEESGDDSHHSVALTQKIYFDDDDDDEDSESDDDQEMMMMKPNKHDAADEINASPLLSPTTLEDRLSSYPPITKIQKEVTESLKFYNNENKSILVPNTSTMQFEDENDNNSTIIIPKKDGSYQYIDKTQLRMNQNGIYSFVDSSSINMYNKKKKKKSTSANSERKFFYPPEVFKSNEFTGILKMNGIKEGDISKVHKSMDDYFDKKKKQEHILCPLYSQ